MAISERQRETARVNGAKSRGPRTAEGKGVSRRNALKHGMAGKGDVLPEEMRREVEAEVATFEGRFRPGDAYERGLVEAAALASVRWRRLAKGELERTDGRVRRAVADWDAARAEEVAALAELLKTRPAEAVRRLMRTAEGCDYLADAWAELGEGLEHHGSWGEAEVERFLALLGMAAEPPGAVAAGERLAWYEAARALGGASKAVELARFRGRHRPGAYRVPSVEEARELVLTLAREQAEAYERMAEELWEAVDGPERESAPGRAMFDGGPETARLARYMADAERTRRRALAELEARRKEEERGRREARGETVGEAEAAGPGRCGEGREPGRNEPGAGGEGGRNEPGAGVIGGAWEVPLTIGRAVGTPVTG